MKLNDLFSFKGEIGRAHLWLIVIVNGVVGEFLNIIPVRKETIHLSSISQIDYVLPIEPVTALSFIQFAVYTLCSLGIMWIVLATMVKRLHDLGQSGKWVVYILSALAIHLLLQFALVRAGVRPSVLDFVGLIVFLPIGIIGGWGGLQLFFVEGFKARPDKGFAGEPQ